jgi:hypothetical protein
MELSPQQVGNRELADQFDALLQKALHTGAAPKDVDAFAKILRAHPELWVIVGDLAEASMRLMLSAKWLPPAMNESVRVGLKEMRKDLGFETASPLEKLLINQVILCWIAFHQTQMRHDVDLENGSTIPNALFWEKKVTLAQRRYLRAIEALARVRRLKLPAMQLNVAQQQLNVAS